MKKIFYLLTAVTLIGNTSFSLIACDSSSLMTLDKLKSEFTNNNLTITNSWNKFWGYLTKKQTTESYYQLLVKQLFDQNKVNHKYESDVQIQTQDQAGDYSQATNLQRPSPQTFKSTTPYRIKINYGGNYVYIRDLNINWKLTADQQVIYPLIFKFQTFIDGPELTIYDTNTSGYPNDQVQISKYPELKTVFNHQYGANTYQYTDLGTTFKDKYLKTDGSVNSFNLNISYQKSQYTELKFTVFIYNIKEIFSVLHNIFNNHPTETVTSIWFNSNINDVVNQFLTKLIQNYGDNPGISQLANFANGLTFTDNSGQKTGQELPTTPGTTTIVQIHYNNQIKARIRVMDE